MNFWLLLNILFLNILAVSSAMASSGSELPGESHAVQSSIMRVVQAGSSDSNKSAGKSSGQSGSSLPAIAPEAKQSTSYHRRSDSYATNPDSDPPRYVRRLSDIGVDAFKDITWLDIGLEHRTRYEWRHNEIRRLEGGDDNAFLLRNRAWIGVRDIIDPYRFENPIV